MSRPIRHGFGLIPPLEYPHGGAFALAIAMDTEIDLDEHTAAVHLRARYGAAPRPVYLATESGTGLAKTGQTLTITLAPDLVDETADSDLTLGALQDQQDVTYRIDFRDGEEALVLRLQGAATFVPGDSDWGDSPATVAVPQIGVTIAANGAVSVAVSVLTTGGTTVDNAAVVAAIEEDAAAVREALELGSAALAASGDFAAATHNQGISTITGLQDALDAKAATASLGTAATKNSGEANGVASLGSDGKIPSAQLPAIAIVDYLGTAANEAAMLALTGQKGDWAQRTDRGTMWFITGDDPTQLASWREMTYPTAPVLSVAGLTGSIASGDLRTALGLATTDSPAFAGASISGKISKSGSGAMIGSSAAFGGVIGIYPGTHEIYVGDATTPTVYAVLGNLDFDTHRGLQCTSGGGIAWVSSASDARAGTRDTRIHRIAAGRLRVTTGATAIPGDIEVRACRLAPIAISALPTAASNTGWRYEVNDANAPSVGATVSAGGSAACEVRSNGTAWIVTAVF